jgi:hypothetical protein
MYEYSRAYIFVPLVGSPVTLADMAVVWPEL